MNALHNKSTQRKMVLASLLATALIETSFPVVVMAADVLEEVIVTARKREESLQESPVAVSVMTGASPGGVGHARHRQAGGSGTQSRV